MTLQKVINSSSHSAKSWEIEHGKDIRVLHTPPPQKKSKRRLGCSDLLEEESETQEMVDHDLLMVTQEADKDTKTKNDISGTNISRRSLL